MDIQRCNIWWIWQWIRTSQSSCNTFCLVIKETCGLELSWWKIMHFLLTNSRHFSSSAAFTWSTWGRYLLELIELQKELLVEDSLPTHIYTTSPSLDEDQPLVWLVVVPRPLALCSLPFHIIVQYLPFIVCHKLFLKWNVFIMFKQSHMWKYERCFFHLCGTQTWKP